jgi:hypothetical protein
MSENIRIGLWAGSAVIFGAWYAWRFGWLAFECFSNLDTMLMGTPHPFQMKWESLAAVALMSALTAFTLFLSGAWALLRRSWSRRIMENACIVGVILALVGLAVRWLLAWDHTAMELTRGFYDSLSSGRQEEFARHSTFKIPNALGFAVAEVSYFVLLYRHVMVTDMRPRQRQWLRRTQVPRHR